MILFHNPRCSKSREALQLLESENCSFEIRDYLKNPLSKEELQQLLKDLGLKASGLVRKKEAKYIELFGVNPPTEARILTAMCKFPQLIERPIIIQNGKAIIGRPVSLIVDYLAKN